MITITLIYIAYATALVISIRGMKKQRFSVETNAAIRLNRAALVYGFILYMVGMVYYAIS